MSHPRATFKEIETVLDERLAGVQTRVLADAAMASAARDMRASGPGHLAQERAGALILLPVVIDPVLLSSRYVDSAGDENTRSR